jgi:hypothetical protein
MSKGWAGHNYSGTKWYGRTVGPTFPGTQGTVLGWTNSWSTLGYICHKDQTFLRPSVHGPKRAGLNVTRTKGRGTKHQGTAERCIESKLFNAGGWGEVWFSDHWLKVSVSTGYKAPTYLGTCYTMPLVNTNSIKAYDCM